MTNKGKNEMTISAIPPATRHPVTSPWKEGSMHPWLAQSEVAYRQAQRHRDADDARLATRNHRAPGRPVLSPRARLGALLIRAGEALGATPSPSAGRGRHLTTWR
jgi:hypothetical protein